MVFTDSEEFGPGLGAAAFLEEHPWAQEIGVALNFEALGKTGPSLMFETGPDSGWLVREFGRVTSHPVAQAWVYEIYRRIPVGTDLTEYINAGIAGLNFLYLEEGTVYHSMLDNPETIDPRSLQHHGAYALSLTRHLGNIDLEDAQATSSGNVIYFTLFSGLLVSYPTTLVMPLVVLATLALIGVAIIGVRRRQLNIRHVFLGLLAFSVSVIAAVGLVVGILNLVTGLHEEYQAMFILGRIYNAHLYMFAFIALAIAVITTVHVIFRRRVKVTDLAFGALLFWWIMAVGGSLFLPGFSYLFTWPLLFSTLALGWVLWREPLGEYSLQRVIIPTVGVIPGIILFAPSMVVMFHYAPTTMIYSTVFFAMLLLGLLIPQIDLITRTRKWWLPGMALLVTVGFLVAGSLTAGFDTEHPRPNAVAYMLNADTGQATWFSPGTRPDTWTSQFLSEEPEPGYLGELFPLTLRSRLPIVKNEAPVIPLDGPEVEILDDQTVNGLRTLRLRLGSPRQAPIITLDVKPYAVVKGVMVDGQRTDNPKEGRSGLWSLVYYAVPSKGVEITLEVEPGQEFTVQVADQSFELPTIPGTTFKPRTDDMMPANFNYGTVVVRTLVFP